MPPICLHTAHHADVTENDLVMMRRAIELGRQAAAAGEVPVGAVVYRGDEILAEAHNLRETASDPTGHAELLAISLAGKKLGEWRLSDCSLAVTLEPCPMCAGAISFARIRRLYFGAADPKGGAVLHGPRLFAQPTCHHAPETYSGIGEAEAGALLRDFFRERR